MLSFLAKHPRRTRTAHLTLISFDDGKSSIQFKHPSDRYLVVNRLPPDPASSINVQHPSPPNCALSPPIHWHSGQDETFHVLQGQARFFLDDEAHSVAAGDVVHIPKRAFHTFRNASTEHELLIEFVLEPRFRERDEAFFRKLSGVERHY